MPIRKATALDIPACVTIIQAYRKRLAEYEPRFWKPATGAAAISALFFAQQFLTVDVAIVAEEEGTVIGFLIAKTVPAPPIYNSGKTALIDDFMIADQTRWDEIGGALLAEARHRLSDRGFAQIVVVNAAKDKAKADFLRAADLSLASQWWTAAL